MDGLAETDGPNEGLAEAEGLPDGAREAVGRKDGEGDELGMLVGLLVVVTGVAKVAVPPKSVDGGVDGSSDDVAAHNVGSCEGAKDTCIVDGIVLLLLLLVGIPE